MTVFVHPNWIEGTLIWIILVFVPLIIGNLVFYYTSIIKKKYRKVGLVILLICLLLCLFAPLIWHYEYNVPSVQEKIITVENWQPTFGHYWGDVHSASDLMMQTTKGELFGNTEKLMFGKFNTRDIFNTLKPNGTYKIKYYGWREGFNNGVPNILSVEEIIDENNTGHHDISNYMNKRSIIYGSYEEW